MSISLALTSTSPIPDLSTLKTKVGDWLDRDDLADKIPTFIQLAEAMFNRELRTPQMEKTTALTATSENTTLPGDYLAMRAIYQEGSPDRPLRATSPSSVRQEFDGTAGVPEAYILVSGGIRLVPPPNATTSLAMDYYARIEPLSVEAPANWLLEQYPDAYLYATLFNAEIYLDNSTRAAQWKELVDQLIAQINAATKADRYGAGPIARSTTIQTTGGRC